MSDLSSKDLAIRHIGFHDVDAFERVRSYQQRLGHEAARVLLERVGGRVAFPGEGCDGVTDLGKWEFCLDAKSKNSHGSKADRLRCPGKCIQILGRPREGWMSGEEFLEVHRVDGSEVDALVREAATTLAVRDAQMRLPL